MPMAAHRFIKPAVGFCVLAFAGASAALPIVAERAVPLSSVIIIGGGPTADHNQVAIESNVRYVSRLLPAQAHKSTLFADGDTNSATVLYVDDVKTLPEPQQTVALAIQGNDQNFTTYGHYRKPTLPGSLDGPSTRDNVGQLIDRAAVTTPSDHGGLLLYFTGHGSPLNGNLDNNHYDLWGKAGNLSVKDLSGQIAHLPPNMPVYVVMAQCYSGAFGNLLFEGGDPTAGYSKRDIVGYFASTKNRVAAGCTTALNEAEYHDFTSYFFAALTGSDRMGRRVTGADFNRDGKVGMDEAFAWTLVNDQSIDTPVCTSDVLLRHDVPFVEEEVIKTPYSDLKKWATRPQRAALEGLSEKLALTSEDRYAQADKMMSPHGDPTSQQLFRDANGKFRQLRTAQRQFLLARWPDLRNSGSQAYQTARTEAAKYYETNTEAKAAAKELIAAYDAMQKASEGTQQPENMAAYAIRFVRVATSVVLAHRLQQTGTPEQKARFARQSANERRPLLEAATANTTRPTEPNNDINNDEKERETATE